MYQFFLLYLYNQSLKGFDVVVSSYEMQSRLKIDYKTLQKAADYWINKGACEQLSKGGGEFDYRLTPQGYLIVKRLKRKKSIGVGVLFALLVFLSFVVAVFLA